MMAGNTPSPCIAQRVCAIGTCEMNDLLASLERETSLGLSPSMPMPAESYPRYSRRESPLQRISQMALRSWMHAPSLMTLARNR